MIVDDLSIMFLQNDYNLSSNRGTTYKTCILDPFIFFGGCPKSLKWSSRSRPLTDLVRKNRPRIKPTINHSPKRPINHKTWLIAFSAWLIQGRSITKPRSTITTSESAPNFSNFGMAATAIMVTCRDDGTFPSGCSFDCFDLTTDWWMSLQLPA